MLRSKSEMHQEFSNNLPIVEGKLKELKAARTARIPEGERLKRAEAELEKRRRQYKAAKEASIEVKKVLAERQKNEDEAAAREAEAEAEHERVRTLIMSPVPNAKLAQPTGAAEGLQDIIKMLPQEIVHRHGCTTEALEAVKDVLGKIPAMLQEATARREKDEADLRQKAEEEEEENERKRKVQEADLGKGADMAVDGTGDAARGDEALDKFIKMALEQGNSELQEAAKLCKRRGGPY